MSLEEEILQVNEQVEQKSSFIESIKKELSEKIVGQTYMIDRLLIGLLSNGHVLLEGVPGLAKTLTIKSLASAVQGQFSRIQFTPDLLPADVIGTMIYHQQKAEFVVRKGPVFANFILADEINRAPAKVQSALLEAMQEKQVTISDASYKLPEPFLVLATQNPLEQEGTYMLPEAQVDRFMLKVVVGYPTKQEELQIIRQEASRQNSSRGIQPIITLEAIKEARELVSKIYMDEKIEKYILDIVFATRYPEQYGLDKLRPFISYGGSPRASINLALAGKAHAFMQGRGYVIPEDIKAICKDVMRHRIGITYEAEAENTSSENIIDEILKTVQVP
ncbi:MoxR family ATPase [Arachidicoccus ginsenosidivorans]|jgi:MoxR-like ATPase|uniref:MoxR family ATPase n=1 Tax=Arachidicoccus ginsenosidivorans TaxID=496057 RepID=A0A5B8VLZ0_9BACT|nr:MoxR family ATPase [Arachidicoccus ginsenosidivorans]QEC72547.1 MoxR family ATPase [Arachidicoccus ginsenosidivorans]